MPVETTADIDAPNKPFAVTDADFDDQVLDSDLPVLVDFWASWCGPCRALAPGLERLADELAGSLKVVKYNTERNQAVAQAMGIRSLPTLVLFKDGEVSDVQIGAVPFPRLEKWVKKRLEPKRSLVSRLFGKKEDAESG